MEIIKAFNSNNLHTEIIIKGTPDKPLFRASDIGIVLEISQIRSVIRDFNETEKVVHSMHTHGGAQEVTFLTAKGLYKVLFKSRKPIAAQFQNWVCDIIEEIRLTGKYDLEKQLEDAKNEIIHIEETNKTMLIQQKILEREKILLKEYATAGAIFYVIKVKTFENGRYIVKVGESRKGVLDRYKEHKTKYEECLLLDCFIVNKSKDFETFIKEHDLIRGSKVNDLPSHETEMELFLIGKNLSYQTLLNIINNNIKYFNNNDTNKLELEIEHLKLMLEMKNSNNDNLLIQELIKNVKQLSGKIDNLENSNKNIANKLNSLQTKTTTNFQEPLATLGPRLQQINSETMTINKVYESIAECIKEYNFKVKRPSIVKAIEDSSVYNGFRWAFVDRNTDPNIIANILPTKQTKTQNLGYIAKLNKEKTEILNVYLDRKTAATSNNYASSSSLDTPVKNMSLTNGHYYILYDKCEDELKNIFVQKYGEPLLYKDGIGQYNAENNLLAEFVCKYDCIKQLKMSDKTLAKALDKNILYNNYYFKSIGSKLKCL
jgi:prophage antirepressor-like protein